MLTAHAKVVDGGRLVLPADIRRAMKLEKGDSVVLQFDGEALHIRSTQAIIRELQEIFLPYRGKPSMVDELIEERRREAATEDRGA